MSQFDFRAGTRGAAFCIPSGNDKVANPTTNKAIGLTIEPRNVKEVRYSKITVKNVIPQVKNIRDSYKLLNGKYPFSNHRHPNSKPRKIFAVVIPKNPILALTFTEGKAKLIH